MTDEELVQVNLGDDYDRGAFFTTDWGAKDHLVPRSTLERWEAVQAAYEAMQAEIDQAMSEQSERVSALSAERWGPKGPLQTFIEQAYAKQMAFALNVPPLLRGPKYKDPE